MPKLKDIKQHALFKLLTNRYVFIALLFIVWMFFIDANSFFIHKDLNDEKEVLERRKKDFKTKIEQDKKKIKTLEDSKGLEAFARESYYIKKHSEYYHLKSASIRYIKSPPRAI